MKATSSADTAPITNEPTKIKINDPIAWITSWPGSRPLLPTYKMVVYITIATASLKILSPNTIV